MNFDEVVVKESPGLCRCCLSEGCYKDLGSEYSWMNETEIYADMLLECFDISITQHMDGPNGPNRLICEVCITRLRDACNFKKQVLDSEKKFVDMLARGEFRNKVMVYDSNMKQEPSNVQADALEVEYLDEMDFGDDADPEELLRTDTEAPETTQSDDITVSTLPVKRGRGRPRKNPEVVTPKKKIKVAKVDEKPRSSKAASKGIREEHTERLSNIRRNIVFVLHYGNVAPFHWNATGFKCFYCNKDFLKSEKLIQHTRTAHKLADLETFIPQRVISKHVPINVDVEDIACKVCSEPFSNIDELISHISTVHEDKYDYSAGVCFLPFDLSRGCVCVLCDEKFDTFLLLKTHMSKEHIKHPFMCQICGLRFLDKSRMTKHFKNSHVGYNCVKCGKLFETFNKLEKHKDFAHGIIKTFDCTLCSARLPNDYNLKVHMGKVHNVEKYIIKCEHCSKECSTKGAMIIHMRSMHSEVRYQCDLCDYTSGIKWLVTLHKRKHFGEREYECSICKRRFGRSSNLSAHIKVHTGKCGRVCRICRQGFVDKLALCEHHREVHCE